ncbi:MAG: iron-containing alcohol dehydrogenase [Gammaproteobacteria bacterium]|nr:iron-containing alcohol dehydrogenase [Gammaproteobacteria bacterium]
MSNNFYEFFCPVKIIAGRAALEHAPFELSVRGAGKVLVVTDSGIKAAGLLQHVLTVFDSSQADIATVYDQVLTDSSMSVIKEIADIYRQHQCDSMIAIGGGSVIDTSKAVNILVSEGGDDLLAYSGHGCLKHPLKPLFVIPTTAGTGSEVTSVAVIKDEDNERKVGFSSHFLFPDVAILDPRMTQTLPPHITAMTAMDALTHACEAAIGIAKNPVSDAYAHGAIEKVSQNLMTVMDNPGDIDGRMELAQAATMAGIAFSNSMVGVVHSLGHSVGAICHLPHGMCMSIFLPYALEYNLENCRQEIADLLLPLAGAERFSQVPEGQRAETSIRVIREMRDQLFDRCQLPRTLEETGKVQKDQFEAVANATLNDGSIIFNAKEVEFNDAMRLLEKAWA